MKQKKHTKSTIEHTALANSSKFRCAVFEQDLNSALSKVN
jgi:hypothetical protein